MHIVQYGDPRKQIVEAKLLKMTILLNDTSPTHITLSNGSISYIDLTMYTSTLAQRLKLSTLSDINSSDHLPILTNFMIRKGDTNTNQTKRCNKSINGHNSVIL